MIDIYKRSICTIVKNHHSGQCIDERLLLSELSFAKRMTHPIIRSLSKKGILEKQYKNYCPVCKAYTYNRTDIDHICKKCGNIRTRQIETSYEIKLWRTIV